MKFPIVTIPFILLFGCHQPPPDNANWSGTLTLAEEKKLPVRLHLNLASAQPTGSFVVGDEYTPIPEIRRTGDSLIILISEYQAAMKGLWNGREWTGTFQRYRTDTVQLPFVIRPEEKTAAGGQAIHESASAIRLTGTFRVYYQNRGRIDSSSVAKFWTRKDSVFGTFIDPSGDHGLMIGTQSGDTARLGRFIGWQANLIEVYYQTGTWAGKYYSRQFPPDLFTLVPSPGIPKGPLDAKRTRMKNPGNPFRFEGLTVSGDTIRNNDSRFKGKALIIDIMGTWCHNCLDEAPILQKLYTEFQTDGLEIIGLSFEVTDDPVVGRKNLLIYQQRHGLTFPIVYAGSLAEKNVQQWLHSQLDDFFAYPTALFIDRSGKVRDIHWGFKGPGTGEEYQHEVEKFYELAREILHSKP